MRLFHLTKKENQESILRDGFPDSEVIEAGQKFVGVRLFDDPIGCSPSRDVNDILFTIEIPEDVMLKHEWSKIGSPLTLNIRGVRFRILGNSLHRHRWSTRMARQWR